MILFAEAPSEGSGFPWTLGLFLLALVLLEAWSLAITGKLYSALVIDHILHAVKQLKDEFVSGNSIKTACGYALAVALVALIVGPCIYLSHAVMTGHDTLHAVAWGCIMAFIGIMVVIVVAKVNHSLSG